MKKELKNKNKKNKKIMDNKGFTLIELLAVVVILSVIMLVAIPSIGTVLESSKKKAFESNAKLISSAVTNCALEQNTLSQTPAQILITCGTPASLQTNKYLASYNKNYVYKYTFDAGTGTVNKMVVCENSAITISDTYYGASAGDTLGQGCSSGYYIVYSDGSWTEVGKGTK